ncbi:MAG: PfkB family carbohydrate kinase [Patescibacteria group bacterium]
MNMHISSRDKIFKLEDAAVVLDPLRAFGKKIVHCHGCFDLLHPGHAMHFEAAKREGDILVVTLTSDRHVNMGPGRPVFPQDMRAAFIAAIGCVDYVAIDDHQLPVEAIRLIRPDVYVKGGQYAELVNDETAPIYRDKEAVESVGGRIHFTTVFTNSGEEISSNPLLNRHFSVFSEETQIFLQEFRQKYNADSILAALEKIRGLKILLIGDAVVDEYHYVRPMGKTSKANIIATRFLNEESFSGGVFACANHVAGFCDNVHVVSSLGRMDTKEEIIRSHLKPNITTKFLYREDCQTTVKRRYVDSNFLGKLFEVYYFEDQPLSEETDTVLQQYLASILPEYDVVISLDYAHGLLSPAAIELLASKSRFLAVNTQTNAANIGYNPITKYPRADFVCIDEPELRLATRDRFGAVEPLLAQVVTQLSAPRGIVTRGHKGCLVSEEGNGFLSIPVFSQKVVDAVGAGDAFFAITAPCVAAGLPMELVGFIGNAVGAQAVMIVGNRESVEPVALSKAIKAIMA